MPSMEIVNERTSEWLNAPLINLLTEWMRVSERVGEWVNEYLYGLVIVAT